MKYIKVFETQPKIGQIKYDFDKLQFDDFIVAYRAMNNDDIININNNIIENNKILDIAKILDKQNVNFNTVFYAVRFSNEQYLYIDPKNIVFASTRKKDAIDHLKMLKISKKFNL